MILLFIGMLGLRECFQDCHASCKSGGKQEAYQRQLTNFSITLGVFLVYIFLIYHFLLAKHQGSSDEEPSARVAQLSWPGKNCGNLQNFQNSTFTPAEFSSSPGRGVSLGKNRRGRVEAEAGEDSLHNFSNHLPGQSRLSLLCLFLT